MVEAGGIVGEVCVENSADMPSLWAELQQVAAPNNSVKYQFFLVQTPPPFHYLETLSQTLQKN